MKDMEGYPLFFDGPGPLRNLLLDERNKLRDNPGLDAKLRAMIAKLPDETEHDNDQEAFQLGMGLAHVEHVMPSELRIGEDTNYDPGTIRHAFNAFIATQPKYRFEFQTKLFEAVEMRLNGQVDQPMAPSINEYQLSAAIAFIAGYIETKRLLPYG